MFAVQCLVLSTTVLTVYDTRAATDSEEESLEGDSDKRAPENMHFPHSDDNADSMLADTIAEKHSTSGNENSPRDDPVAEEHSNTVQKEDSLSNASSTEEISTTALKELQDDNT